MDDSRDSASIETFFQSCDELDLPYLIPSAYESTNHCLSNDRLELSILSNADLERYCNLVREHSLDIELIGPRTKSIVFCSKTLDRDFLHVKGKASILSISESGPPKGFETIIQDGVTVRTLESPILVDPRETMGRFFHLLSGMKAIDKLVVAWISSMIYNDPPEVVFYDEALSHGRIAATMLGYEGKSLRVLGN